MSGGTKYNILLNGNLITTYDDNIDLSLSPGINTIRVTANKECQGVYEEIIFISEDILLSPNPANASSKRVTYAPTVETHPVSRQSLIYFHSLPEMSGSDKGIRSLDLTVGIKIILQSILKNMFHLFQQVIFLNSNPNI